MVMHLFGIGGTSIIYRVYCHNILGVLPSITITLDYYLIYYGYLTSSSYVYR